MTGEGGSSLLNVIIGMGLLTTVIFLFGGGQSVNGQARRSVQSTRSSLDMEEAWRGAIIQAVRADACFSPNNAFYSQTIGEFGRARYQTNLALSTPARKADAQATVEQAARAAAGRCQTPRLTTASRYFCLEFPRNAAAPVGSMFNAEKAYSEVLIQYRNAHTGKKVSCQDANNNPTTTGIDIHYSVYWQGRGPMGPYWTTSTGGLYVAR